MALRDWPARKLGRAWLVGAALQVAVLASLWTVGRLTESPEQREVRHVMAADRVRMDSVMREGEARADSIRRGLRPPLAVITPEQQAQASAMLRDSFGITWETRGNHTTVHLPPEMAKKANNVAVALSDALRWAMILAAIIFLPIPVCLLALTGAWLVVRRPWRREPVLEEAA